MTTSLVVGANRGIGLELVKVLAGRGDTVIAACRRSSEELNTTGARVIQDVDVTSDISVRALVEALGNTALDLVILNAGILERTGLQALDMESVRRQFEVNAMGPLRLATALRPRLKRGTKLGVITSRMGSIEDNASGGSYGYRMSKAALNAAARSLSHDLKGDSVAVAILHPGWVRTDMTAGTGNVGPDEAARMLVQRLDALTLESSGTFWHANGKVLPW